MSDPQKVILLTDGAGLAVAPHALRTDDGRENWTALPIQFASAAALDPNDPQRTIVGKARTHDAFLMRVGASGEVLYAARIGGEDNETITSLAVDASGAAYAAGATLARFPFDHPSAARSIDSSLQAFLLKLSPDGASAAFVTGIGHAYSSDRQLEPVLVGRDGSNRSHATVCRRFGPPPDPCSTLVVDGSGAVVQSFSDAPGWLFATDPAGSEYFVSDCGSARHAGVGHEGGIGRRV